MNQNTDITSKQSGFGIYYEQLPKIDYWEAVKTLSIALNQSVAAKNVDIRVWENSTHIGIELRRAGMILFSANANKEMENYKHHAAKHFLTMVCVKGLNQITLSNI